MTNIISGQPRPALAEPRFKIGQDVHLKTGGPEMVVNQCTQGADGQFIVNTIWFGVGNAEERGTYQEVLLEAKDMPLIRRARLG
jgi:uncharacterized protein YodC (DUF2158 family)